MTEFLRETKFIGAYDWRGKSNYGIHGMDLFFSVKGPKGAIGITIFTNWMLPAQQASTQAMYSKGYLWEPGMLCRPRFTDISYHAKEPQYDGQPSHDDCHLTDGPCYCDGSSLWGDECWREGFLHGGSDWLFSRMEDEYRHRFENGPPVDLTPIPRPHPSTQGLPKS